MPATVIAWFDPSKSKSRMICEAFASACGEVRPVTTRFVTAPAAFYGVTPDSVPIFNCVLEQGATYYYIDNAYFGRGEYYRVTRNAKQHKGVGRARPDRFRAFGIDITPWKKTGTHILVNVQSHWWYELNGTTLEGWLSDSLSRIQAVSDRPIRIRRKPAAKRGMADENADLSDVWAVVTHSSNTAVEAVLEGVPVFCTADDCAGAAMGTSDLSRIETPLYPDGRLEWAKVLAANQWTLEEMRSGLCWQMLNNEEN